MIPPIFLSGPHGSGKTTLLNELLNNELIIESDFEIDFLSEFPSMKILSDFERCLLRLYHRIYLSNYTHNLAEDNPEKTIITSRGIYDSAAYINTYQKLGWISKEKYKKLDFIINNLRFKPYTIVLNPPFEVVKERLMKRREIGVRKERDEIFKSEDSDLFLKEICNYFETLKHEQHVLYIEDNGEKEIKKIMSWIEMLKTEKQKLLKI